MDIYGICWQNSEATILGVDLAFKLVSMELNLIGMIALLFPQIRGHSKLVYDENPYFGLGPILKPKPKLADTEETTGRI